jgi:hypothetical protein
MDLEPAHYRGDLVRQISRQAGLYTGLQRDESKAN